jgi:hypothetical protein
MKNKDYAVFCDNPEPSLCNGRSTYVESVPLPLGLVTIVGRLDQHYYRSALAFKSDVETLTANCQLFNGVCAPSTPLSISLSSHSAVHVCSLTLLTSLCLSLTRGAPSHRRTTSSARRCCSCNRSCWQVYLHTRANCRRYCPKVHCHSQACRNCRGQTKQLMRRRRRRRRAQRSRG